MNLRRPAGRFQFHRELGVLLPEDFELLRDRLEAVFAKRHRVTCRAPAGMFRRRLMRHGLSASMHLQAVGVRLTSNVTATLPVTGPTARRLAEETEPQRAQQNHGAQRVQHVRLAQLLVPPILAELRMHDFACDGCGFAGRASLLCGCRPHPPGPLTYPHRQPDSLPAATQLAATASPTFARRREPVPPVAPAARRIVIVCHARDRHRHERPVGQFVRAPLAPSAADRRHAS